MKLGSVYKVRKKIDGLKAETDGIGRLLDNVRIS